MGSNPKRIMNNNSDEKGLFLSPKALNAIFIIQVAVNIMVLGLIVAGLIYTLGELNQASERQEAITRVQIEFIQEQNDKQLCAQHDIIQAVRQLSRGLERVLGLPSIAKIRVPNVSGINCRALSN